MRHHLAEDGADSRPFIGAWRSLVARSAGGRKVASSNLAAPTARSPLGERAFGISGLQLGSAGQPRGTALGTATPTRATPGCRRSPPHERLVAISTRTSDNAVARWSALGCVSASLRPQRPRRVVSVYGAPSQGSSPDASEVGVGAISRRSMVHGHGRGRSAGCGALGPTLPRDNSPAPAPERLQRGNLCASPALKMPRSLADGRSGGGGPRVG
jgi:hypothetical protein